MEEPGPLARAISKRGVNMSFNVRFWTFTKKYNSTKRPVTDEGTLYTCVIKDGSSIVNPKIELNLGMSANPSAYNYCRIASFDRYYYIREWSFDKGLWTATLATDVLATYKDEIGAASLYMLRASNEKNGRVVDNKYPCKVNCDYDKSTITEPFEHAGAGCYVVGVVSPRGMYGSITYYILDRTGLGVLCQYLINDAVSVANNFSLSDASLALQNSIVDPIQYIKSVVWLPFPYTELPYSPQQPLNLNIFNWAVPNTDAQVLFGATVVKNYTFTVIKHPDTNARGNYVNAAPYTKASLSFPPFGVIDLDTTVLADVNSINAELRLDCLTGKGILTLTANNIILNRLEAQIGVPIQIAQVSSDYVGAATSIAGGVAGAVGNVMSGNIAGAIAGGVGAIGNAIDALTPRAQTIGTGGSYAHLRGSFELDFQFFRPVDDDNAHNGRPLCAKRQVSVLGGYMLVQDGDVPIAGTVGEGDAVKAFLESGFYYE